MRKMRVFGRLVATIALAIVSGQQGIAAGAEESSEQPEASVKSATPSSPVKVGSGTQFTIGGFDISNAEDLPRVLERLKQELPRMKAAGVTSHETYVRWNLVETSPGKFDFSLYDKIALLDQSYGIRWVPFLIIGPGYATPDWFYNSKDSVKYICLEHGEQSCIESLWNPRLPRHISRFIKEFSDHYKPMGVIESVLLGITGNYGEAIYPATAGEDWTGETHGKYHSHPGFWAGDEYAIKDFQRWLQFRYTDIASLNREWRTNHRTFSTIRPFLRKDAPSTKAWLDMLHWYRGSMNDWAGFWMKTTRKYFIDTDIYLCTGGHADPRHGSDFGDQCEIAASVGAGVRITNEGSSYTNNFSLTRWVSSAGKVYGAYFGFEPAGGVSPEAVAARCYNATASGAKQLHYYFPNIFRSPQAEQNWLKAAPFFQKRRPKVDVAIFYPQTDIELGAQDFLRYPRSLRDFFDFDFLSEGMILDGGLMYYKVLIFMEGHTADISTLRKIRDWCLWDEGKVIASRKSPPLKTVEEDDLLYQRILETDGAIVDEGPREGYYRFLAKTLSEMPVLSQATRDIIAEDSKTQNLYFTLFEDGEILILNQNPEDVTWGFMCDGKYMRPTIPAYGIWSSKAEGSPQR
jgi:hypothetical protein